MRRRGKRELAALLTVALLAGSAACGADAGEKDAATGTAEAAAGQDTETAAGQGTDAQAGAQENLEETALSLMREVNPAEAAGTDDLYGAGTRCSFTASMTAMGMASEIFRD